MIVCFVTLYSTAGVLSGEGREGLGVCEKLKNMLRRGLVRVENLNDTFRVKRMHQYRIE